jgi:hypothetical protein
MLTYEVYEKQRRHPQGWTGELLAGDGSNFSEAIEAKDTIGKPVASLDTARPPQGYRFVDGGAWVIGEWCYGKSFKNMGVHTRGEQSMDTCRWRKHSRALENLTNVEFGREPACGICSKSFSLLRRRHHCRGCHAAMCKGCSRKAVDHSANRIDARPEWYCLTCIANNMHLESRSSMMRRPSIVNEPRQDLSRMPSMKSMKFCIECGYELPLHVKFCIDCGAGQGHNTITASRDSNSEELMRLSMLRPESSSSSDTNAASTIVSG